MAVVMDRSQGSPGPLDTRGAGSENHPATGAPMIPGRHLVLAVLVSAELVSLGAVAGGGVWSGCAPSAGGWGRVRILESHVGPTSWTVLVADQGQGVELFVDGSPRHGLCRRGGQGIRCWVGGLRPGYHGLAVSVAGRSVVRRSVFSGRRRLSREVLYEVLLDRFADGDTANNLRVRPGDPAAAHGGDLRGLKRRLGHLRWLGVTALLLSPVWEARGGPGPQRPRRPSRAPGWTAPSYVGAAPLRRDRLSRSLGSPRAMLRLLRAARRRGLRVVLDLPRAGASLDGYLALARTWVTRTFADGLRVGPFRPGEERAWASAFSRLSASFSPLMLIHHGSGDPARLRTALQGLPPAARLLEESTWGRRLLEWILRGAPFRGGAGRGLGSLPQEVRLLSGHRWPVLSRRVPAGRLAVPRAALALTLHLLMAEIPKVYYADEMAGAAQGQPHPDMDWSAPRASPRRRLIRRVLGLRRSLKVLRMGRQRTWASGDLLVVGREIPGCRALLVANRSPAARRLTLDIRRLGWPATGSDVELVDRLGGRGFTVTGNRLTVQMRPLSVRVLVVTGSGARCG